MSHRRCHLLALFAFALCVAPAVARADLVLCNRMSYIVEAALGIEDKGTASTSGWFRVDPGQCRILMPGEVTAERFLLHARALAVYGASPMPQDGHSDLCVGRDSFALASARVCRSGTQLVRFTEVKPAETEKGQTLNLAEEAEYSAEQARDAAIQRLLVIAGYDAAPIDGIRGGRTEAALLQFLADNKLPAQAATRDDFFDTLIRVAQNPGASGFAWCNDTLQTVMAALGLDERGGIVTRGWYRVEPGKCLRPDVPGKPRRLFSFGEAVGADGAPLTQAGRPTAWGGDTRLCTRAAKFELSDQSGCNEKGLTETGFANVDLTARAATVRFR